MRKMRKKWYALVALLACACGGSLENGDGGADASGDGTLDEGAADVGVDGKGDGGDASLASCPDAGVGVACEAGAPPVCDGCAPPAVLAACQPLPTVITLDDANVYWQNLGKLKQIPKLPPQILKSTIVTCAKSGCVEPRALADGLDYTLGINQELSLIVSSGTLYYDWSPDGGASALVGVDSQQCAPTAEIGTWANDLVSDGARLYWTDGNVYDCASQGCTQPLVVWLAPNGDEARGLAADGTTLYWGSVHGVLACAKTGCGTPSTLVSIGVPVGPIAVNSTLILAWSQYGILACPKTGCTGQPTVITPATASASFTADDTNVYWVGGASSNVLYACPLTGCGGAPTQIASGVTITAVTVDAQRVYWVDQGLGMVLDLPK